MLTYHKQIDKRTTMKNQNRSALLGRPAIKSVNSIYLFRECIFKYGCVVYPFMTLDFTDVAVCLITGVVMDVQVTSVIRMIS